MPACPPGVTLGAHAGSCSRAYNAGGSRDHHEPDHRPRATAQDIPPKLVAVRSQVCTTLVAPDDVIHVRSPVPAASVAWMALLMAVNTAVHDQALGVWTPRGGR